MRWCTLTWATSAEAAEGDDWRESDFLMKEKGPGDLGAGGMESVLGSAVVLVGVMVPFSLEPLSEDPSAPESLSASRICMYTHTINSDHSFSSRISFQLHVLPAVTQA